MGNKSRRKAEALARKAQRLGGQTESTYRPPRVSRPFAGLPNEVELVAMREIIPCATLKLRTTKEYGDREFMVATMAPEFSAGAVREDGMIIISASSRSRTNDAAHDLGLTLQALLEKEPGDVVASVNLNRRGPRLTEMITKDAGEFHIYRDLQYWLPEDAEPTAEQVEALNQLRDEVFHTKPISGLDHAYWCEAKGPQYIRWFCPDWEEDEMFDALAQARADGKLDWDNGRLIGVFRGLGMVVPVWELSELLDPEEPDFKEVTKELKAVGTYLKKLRKAGDRLSVSARGIRQSIVSRSVALN